ncbi:MAG TPA: polysaccharide deacetylase family protein [Anaerolineaceae bacterium]
MATPPNPVLKKLGYTEKDRLVLIHTDDIGMCQASVAAYAELDAYGLISCGGVMVPCPWFLEIAAYARQNPKTDLGVHITLTSEWQTFRWKALSTCDPASGLIDEEGCLPRTSEAVQDHASPEAVEAEMETQIQRALAAGMHPTHIDTHMGTVMHLKFIGPYLRLAMKYRLAVMAFRRSAEEWQAYGLDPETAQAGARLCQQIEAMGIPMIDNITTIPFDRIDNHLENAKKTFSSLPSGITHLYFHPSIDSPELRAITPRWENRVADLQVFLSDDLRKHIQSEGIQVIGYRSLQNLLPEI